MNKKVYKKALEKWGAAIQIVMVFEEMAELQKELCKELRNKGNLANIAEEIADVEIMLEQMKTLFKCDLDVVRYKEFKINRLKKMLSEDKHIEYG